MHLLYRFCFQIVTGLLPDFSELLLGCCSSTLSHVVWEGAPIMMKVEAKQRLNTPFYRLRFVNTMSDW